MLAKEKYGIRGRDLAELRAQFHSLHRPEPHERRGNWRLVGSQRRGRSDPELSQRATATVTAGGAVRALQPAVSADVVREINAIADTIAKSGGTPLAVAKDGRLLGVIQLKDIVKGGIRERFAELRRMGIRTVMITGDNPTDRRGDRGGGRRRRLPRPGHARGQAQAHPRRAGQGQARRHVRRRHQRCAGARPGRCRRCHEYRHAGRARGRQHGRSRFQPDQADRDRRDRQAIADDARRADHVLDRQRRGEVLRHHPGDVRRVLYRAGATRAAAGAQHHESGEPAERDPVGDHLQRADHHCADSAVAEGRARIARSAPGRCCAAIC